jgi:DNA replication protein DnaC
MTIDATKTMADLVPHVLHEIKEPSTKDRPRSITSAQFRRIANFSPRNNQPDDEKINCMIDAAAKFACDVNATRPYWLSLLGNSGVGKTRLARAVWRTYESVTKFDIWLDAPRQVIRGSRGQFVPWRNLCSVVREGAWGWVEDLCHDDFVILDDVGAEYDREGSGFTVSILDRILNARREKWTMLTCNLSLEAIGDKLDVRIASRLLRDGNQVIECDANDYAMK